jgi:LacI family transcriptional regulator
MPGMRDITAIADPDLDAAMRFIREHAREGIGVEDVLSQVPVSRSVLQRRFRKLLGRSIHGVVAGVRLQGAKKLLVETDLGLAAIAQRTGFSHGENLCAAFRQAVGLPPGTYRREHAQLA